MPVIHVTGLLLDGRPLDSMMLGLTEDRIDFGEAKPATSLQSVPGRYGAVNLTLTDSLGNAFVGNRDIVLHLYSTGDEQDITDAKKRLAMLQGKATRLSWRTLDGEYRGIASIGAWQDVYEDEMLVASTVDVTLTCQPMLYGRETVRRLEEGRNMVRVPGNRETWPVLTLSPAYGARGLRVECGGRFLQIPDGPYQIGGTVVLDCLNRRATANGNLVQVTLDSDWFPLTPKATEIDCLNCYGSVSFEPMTLI